MKKKRYTTMEKALRWLKKDFVQFDDICKLDYSIFDNAHAAYDEEHDQMQYVLQWFITEFSDIDVEWIEESFSGPFFFTYSDRFDKWILAVCGPWYNDVEVLRDDLNEAYL